MWLSRKHYVTEGGLHIVFKVMELDNIIEGVNAEQENMKEISKTKE